MTAEPVSVHAPPLDRPRLLRQHVARFGRAWFLPNAHPPWPLRTAEVLVLDDGLVAAAAVGALARRPPDHVEFSDGARRAGSGTA